MSLVSIDPGKTVLGWAVFHQHTERLERCGLTHGNSAIDIACAINDDLRGVDCLQAVIEIPQVYQQRMWKGDPNDLIDVAVVAGMVASVLVESGAVDVNLVRPRAWKGTRPKKICNKLTLDTLDASELEVFRGIDCLASLRHNVIDAIGIGLWRLGRR